MKLPKQWKHWLKTAGFSKPGRKYYEQYSFIGFGRQWRINNIGQLQVGKKLDEFDRWAISVVYSTEGIPKTKQEFLERVAFMRKRVARKARLKQYMGIDYGL